MSFATRCTACGTIFRVVQDQLRVSDGWVRCGRCDAVFDAAGGLFDLEQQAPPDWQPAAPPTADPTPVEAATADPAVSEDERRWAAAMAAQGLHVEGAAARAGEAAGLAPRPVAPSMSAVPSQLAASSLPSAPSAPSPPSAAMGLTASAAFEPPTGLLVRNTETAGSTDHLQADEEDDIIVITDHPTSEPRPAAPRPAGSGNDGAAAAIDADGDRGHTTAATEAPPGFLRTGRRRSSWQSGRARALLASLSLLLLVTLVLQAAQQFSELAAASWPASRPALTAWCAVSGCSVGPLHRIDDLVVESTALSPAPAAPGLRLAVTLRNRAAYAVALPSIDLSLTDMGGKLIARRVLSPADFVAPAPAVASLAAGADLPLQTVLTTTGGAASVAGYTVEIFYP